MVISYTSKEKLFSKEWFKAIGLIIIGALALAVGFVYFIMPHHIIPGGVFGLSIVMHELIPLPVGTIALLINIPLTLLGIRLLGPRFGWKTVLGFVLASAFIDLLSLYSHVVTPAQDDTLLSSIFGGLLVGIGIGLIFRARATAAGSPIIAMILEKYTRRPVGQLLMMVDGVIVGISIIVYRDWTLPLYSLVVIYIIGKVVDIVIQGVSYEKTLFIISEKYEEIKAKLLNDVNRGGTMIKAEGMYTGDERKMIFTVVNRRDMTILQDHIKQIDPNAFLTILDANEIFGKGFKEIGSRF